MLKLLLAVRTVLALMFELLLGVGTILAPMLKVITCCEDSTRANA